jgi:hypothetical protein
MFPEQFPAMREAIKLRYALIPYIYKTAFEAYETGVSICRPMYYDYPEKDEAYSYKGEYMFGDDFLVAPVTAPVTKTNWTASKKIWLPEGDWFEYHSGAMLKGNREVERKYAQDEIPFFVKAGAIIPMYPDVKNLQERPSVQYLVFFPGTSKATTELYDDNSESNDYREGAFVRRTVHRENLTDRTMKITIEPIRGSFKGMPENQAFELRLVNAAFPASVTVNGLPGMVKYLGKELTASVEIPAKALMDKIEVVISFDQSFADQQAAFDGNKGFLRRSVWMTNMLKLAAAAKDWGGTLPNPVYEPGNIANLIEYHPGQVYPYMQKLNELKTSMSRNLSSISTLTPEDVRPMIEYMDLKP